MTRETKIGLLVGLAFIVVFAMLLSHSGPATLPGDARQLVRAREHPTPAMVNQGTSESTGPITVENNTPSMTVGSPVGPSVKPPEPSPGAPEGLPTPAILNPTTPGTEGPAMEVATAIPVGPQLEGNRIDNRRAPTIDDLVDPNPGLRDSVPDRSTSPESETLARTASDQPTTPSTPDKPETREVAKADDRSVAREHVVQKGETLNSILRATYGDAYATSYSKVMDLFLKANKGIKNPHMVIEGQKLTMPGLPPALSEAVEPKTAVANDATVKERNQKLVNLENLLNEPQRRKSPSPAVVIKDKEEKETGRDKKATADRTAPKANSRKSPDSVAENKSRGTYEVQTEDTFERIARKQLGDSGRWAEIKRMNPGVDPTRMKPGMKLKLPARRSAAETVASGRS